MSTYLKNMAGYKHNQLKNKSFDDIQNLFDKAMKRSGSKRASTELEQESIKKQNLDEDKKTVELQRLIEVVPNKEDVAIDAIPLATKPSSIVDYKIHKEGKKTYYQIIRADGSSKMYLVFSHMLKSFDREDLETLWKLVKAKHGSTRPEEGRIVRIKRLYDDLEVTAAKVCVTAAKTPTGAKLMLLVILDTAKLMLLVILNTTGIINIVKIMRKRIERSGKNYQLEAQLQALVDGKKIIVTEASVRRDLQLNDEEVFLDKQLEGMQSHKRIYVTPSHTKKIFRNMRRVGKGFSRRDTPLFPTMMVQAQQEQVEGSKMLIGPHHTPTIIQPSTSQPQLKQRSRRPKRKDTKVPQPSGPTDNVTDEAVYEVIDDSLERAATTATSLDAEQDRGNINNTQSKATLNEPSS
ncbi:hypothetical protein Tco_0672475 [Tanacetum coccineum]